MLPLRMAMAILILPFNVMVTVPALILAARHVPLAPLTPLRAFAGGALVLSGLGLAIWTMAAFATIGKGTLAPWDPPRKLVIVGPYRHWRHPMITGVALIVFGEALFFAAAAIGWWGLGFLIANALYLPFIEEPDLVRRFGDDYRAYMQAVPRWRPRFKAWSP